MSQFRTPFLVIRKQPGSYVNGHWVNGTAELFEIQASVQPMSGKDMEMLPEGRRGSQAVKIYTSTQLRTVDDANPAEVQAFGSAFELVTVEPWQSNVISHYKCIGVRTGPSSLGLFARITDDGSERITAEGNLRIFAS